MNIGVMSLIIFLCGIFILVYGLFFAPTEEEEKLIDSSMDMSGVENLLRGLENKLADADKMMAELDKFSEYVTTEMQDKYKEMMFLYQMIDEKEKNIKKEADETKLVKVQIEEQRKELKKEQEEKAMEDARRRQVSMASSYTKNNVKAFYTPNDSIEVSNQKEKAPVMVAKSSFDEVVYMYENGKNVEDIAKALGKGKGEVRLMLDLMGKEG
ncbi:MAG: hypothetical protein MJ245_04555 [Clostridia bacterium]|nr:hypothetical protein [Clostridia bacterium]